MNKYAAEKIASEYYNMGVQLALQGAGLTKTANKNQSLKNALSALLGAGAGAGGLKAHQMGSNKLLTELNTLLGRSTSAGPGIALGQPSAAAPLEKLLAQAEAQSAKFSPEQLMMSTGAGPGIALGQPAAGFGGAGEIVGNMLR